VSDELRPPFRADHVGSLLRPPELLTARDQHAAGAVTAEELRAAEDAAIRDAVAMQREVGLTTATDGEFRRTSWHMDFIYQIAGINKADGEIGVHFENADGSIDFTSAALAVDGPAHGGVGRLRRRRRSVVRGARRRRPLPRVRRRAVGIVRSVAVRPPGREGRAGGRDHQAR
jgi:hypothetical protein